MIQVKTNAWVIPFRKPYVLVKNYCERTGPSNSSSNQYFACVVNWLWPMSWIRTGLIFSKTNIHDLQFTHHPPWVPSSQSAKVGLLGGKTRSTVMGRPVWHLDHLNIRFGNSSQGEFLILYLKTQNEWYSSKVLAINIGRPKKNTGLPYVGSQWTTLVWITAVWVGPYFLVLVCTIIKFSLIGESLVYYFHLNVYFLLPIRFCMPP